MAKKVEVEAGLGRNWTNPSTGAWDATPAVEITFTFGNMNSITVVDLEAAKKLALDLAAAIRAIEAE